MLRDLTNIDEAEHIPNGDVLRNINCFEYLTTIIAPLLALLETPKPDQKEFAFLELHPFIMDMANFFYNNPFYKTYYAYGDLYEKFLKDFETAALQIIEQLKKFPEHKTQVIKQLINHLYHNSNFALERTARMIAPILEVTLHTSKEVEEKVRARMYGKTKSKLGSIANTLNFLSPVPVLPTLNKTTPQAQGSPIARFMSIVSSNYKPHTLTSLVSIKIFSYKNESHPFEYRMGTVGQYHNRKARISPLFLLWAFINQPKELSKQPIFHIYFNLLKRGGHGYEEKREGQLTEKLEEMESQYPHIAVITLPADDEILKRENIFLIQPSIPVAEARRRILAIATQNQFDFFISEKIKELLYGKKEKTQEGEILIELLNNAFKKMGVDLTKINPKKGSGLISPAQEQAIYFHFMKFELPNFIINTLKPHGYNFSCKDGIDRGGVASAYFNLIKSIECGTPLITITITKKEFYQALHAPPALVKGRGMNSHSKLIWNATNFYVNANPTSPDWLKEWRDKQAPPGTCLYCINKFEEYIAAREDKDESYSSFAKYNKGQKLSVAKKILASLKENLTRTSLVKLNLTEQEMEIAMDGDLGKVTMHLNSSFFDADLLLPNPVNIENNIVKDPDNASVVTSRINRR